MKSGGKYVDQHSVSTFWLELMALCQGDQHVVCMPIRETWEKLHHLENDANGKSNVQLHLLMSRSIYGTPTKAVRSSWLVQLQDLQHTFQQKMELQSLLLRNQMARKHEHWCLHLQVPRPLYLLHFFSAPCHQSPEISLISVTYILEYLRS